MRTTLALIAAPALMLAAAPALAGSQSFTHDGYSYTYEATRAPHGVVLLTGRVKETGEAFRLRVDGSRVTGQMDARQVDFRVSPKTAAALDADLLSTLAAN